MKINFENVSYKYNKKDRNALENINLVLEDSKMVFVMGSVGSGKSTLIQHLNGLLCPSKGKLTINVNDKEYQINKKEKRMKELRKNVGLLFQFPENQLFETTVLKDVMFGPENFGLTPQEVTKHSKAALTLVKLNESYYSRSPLTLSGGEKRKAAMAGVLASGPKIFALDEPTSSLDNKSKKDLFKLLCELKNRGNMIIVVSHDVDLCYEYADEVVLLNEGKVLYHGDCKSAFENLELLNNASLSLPFVLEVKNKLNLSKEVQNIEELAIAIKEEYPYGA